MQIRVSSEISNAPIILNVDCDMYSNNSDAIKEALCFFMGKERGHMTSYVQYPQSYDNITKNDIYANVGSAIHKVGIQTSLFGLWFCLSSQCLVTQYQILKIAEVTWVVIVQ